MKCETGEDRGFLRRVISADVGGGVGLGVAQRRRLGEGSFQREVLGIHLVEDEVRGAVHDAHDPLHAVTGEAVAQRANDRDRTGDRCLVVHLRTHLIGGVEDHGAVSGEERLIGGHDVGARVNRFEEVAACRLDAAHQLDDDVGTENQCLRVGGEQLDGQVDVAGRINVAHRDANELERCASAVSQFVAVLQEQRRYLAPY